MSRKHFFSIVFFICSYLLTFILLSAQEEEGEKTKISERIVQEKQTHQDTTYQEPGSAFFVEILGKPFSGINADFRINKSSRFSLGINGYYYYEEETEEQEEIEMLDVIPNIVYYYLRGKKNNRLEIGAGLGVMPVWNKDYNYDSPILIHGVIGYRYQKKDGLLFRTGLTFNKLGDLGLLFLGLSLGYSW